MIMLILCKLHVKFIEKEYFNVFADGCLARGLNLFIKNIVQKVEPINHLVEKAGKIIKFVNNTRRHSYH